MIAPWMETQAKIRTCVTASSLVEMRLTFEGRSFVGPEPETRKIQAINKFYSSKCRSPTAYFPVNRYIYMFKEDGKNTAASDAKKYSERESQEKTRRRPMETQIEKHSNTTNKRKFLYPVCAR